VVPAVISRSGSSDSDSGGAGEGAGGWEACGGRGGGAEGAWAAPLVVAIGFGAGTGSSAGWFCGGFGSGAGVSSTVECLPVVQGGMDRNSSKVSTRGLQHFQPFECLIC